MIPEHRTHCLPRLQAVTYILETQHEGTRSPNPSERAQGLCEKPCQDIPRSRCQPASQATRVEKLPTCLHQLPEAMPLRAMSRSTVDGPNKQRKTHEHVLLGDIDSKFADEALLTPHNDNSSVMLPPTFYELAKSENPLGTEGWVSDL